MIEERGQGFCRTESKRTSRELRDVYARASVELVPAVEQPVSRSGSSMPFQTVCDKRWSATQVGVDGPGCRRVRRSIQSDRGFVRSFGKDRVRTLRCANLRSSGGPWAFDPRPRIHGGDAICRLRDVRFQSDRKQLAKTHYRWSQPVRVTVRMPTGAGVGAGPFPFAEHGSMVHPCPGLVIVYPSNPFDAKGLLTTSLLEPNPVLFFEHSTCIEASKGRCQMRTTTPLGKAVCCKARRGLDDRNVRSWSALGYRSIE